MKKNTVIGIIIAGAIAIIIILAAVAGINAQPSGEELSSDDVTIVVPTNGGVPYTWEYEIADPTVVKYVGKREENKAAPNTTGGPVDVIYSFRGIKPGETTITCNYVSITDKSVVETRRYKAMVNDDLVTNLEEILDVEQVSGN